MWVLKGKFMRKLKIILLLLTLTVSSLACNLGTREAEKPEEEIPVTTESVESMLGKIEEAKEQIQSGGEVEMVFTEAEVTSMVAFEIAKQQPQVIEGLQIFLRDGQLQISGDYTDGGVTLPITVIAEPEVTENGGFRIELVTAKIGPIAAPDVLRNQVQQLLDEGVADALSNQAGDRFLVTSVQIADGQITIRGSVP
jgi:uncharacterized protein YpmS